MVRMAGKPGTNDTICIVRRRIINKYMANLMTVVTLAIDGIETLDRCGTSIPLAGNNAKVDLFLRSDRKIIEALCKGHKLPLQPESIQ
jgi:hypothetical protein